MDGTTLESDGESDVMKINRSGVYSQHELIEEQGRTGERDFKNDFLIFLIFSFQK